MAGNGVAVDRRRQVVSTKLWSDERALLEAVSDRRGEGSVAQTLRCLIRDEIERHFPGATEPVTDPQAVA